MAWTGIHNGDYGFTGKVAIVQDSAAQNISTYTTLQFILVKPSGAVLTTAATFDTSGADGVLKYTFVDGDVDEAGTWKMQPRIAKTGVELTGATMEFEVLPRVE